MKLSFVKDNFLWIALFNVFIMIILGITSLFCGCYLGKQFRIISSDHNYMKESILQIINSRQQDPNNIIVSKENREIYISGKITRDIGNQISMTLIKFNSKFDDVNLYLCSSYNGDDDAIFQLINTMSLLSYKVNIIVLGASHHNITILLANATGKRKATKSCIFIVYDPKLLYYNSKYSTKPAINFMKNIKIPPNYKKPDFYFSSQNALEWGIIDEIIW